MCDLDRGLLEVSDGMIRRMTTALAICIGLGAFMIPASPASAHSIALYHGQDSGAVVTHNQVAVLDEECDGNTVFLQFRMSTIGGVVQRSIYDRNGCNNSGATANTYPQQVTRARLCETNVGCTAWRYT
jgi:hypothetical protein